MSARTRSLIVRMERSTSQTWASCAVRLSRMGSKSSRRHSKAMSDKTSTTSKPRERYRLIASCTCASRVSFFPSWMLVTVRNCNLREIVCKNRSPCTNKMSTQRVTSRWSCRMKAGAGSGWYVGTCSAAGRLVVFPYKDCQHHHKTLCYKIRNGQTSNLATTKVLYTIVQVLYMISSTFLYHSYMNNNNNSTIIINNFCVTTSRPLKIYIGSLYKVFFRSGQYFMVTYKNI